MRWVKSKDKVEGKSISRCRIPEGVTPLFDHAFEAGDQGLADLKVAYMELSDKLEEGERMEAWPAFIMSLENLKKKKTNGKNVPKDYYKQVNRLTKFIPVRISGVVDRKRIFSDTQFENLRDLIEVYHERHSALLNYCEKHRELLTMTNGQFNKLDIDVVRNMKIEKNYWTTAVGKARNEVNMTKKFDLIEPALNGLETLDKALSKLGDIELKENTEAIKNILLRYEALLVYFDIKIPMPSDRLTIRLRLKERTRLVLFHLKRIPNNRLDESYEYSNAAKDQAEDTTISGEIKKLAGLTLVLNELVKTFIEEEEIPEIMPFNHFMYNSTRIAS